MRVHQQGLREKGSEEEDLATEGPSERADTESLKVDERESVAARVLSRSADPLRSVLKWFWSACAAARPANQCYQRVQRACCALDCLDRQSHWHAVQLAPCVSILCLQRALRQPATQRGSLVSAGSIASSPRPRRTPSCVTSLPTLQRTTALKALSPCAKSAERINRQD